MKKLLLILSLCLSVNLTTAWGMSESDRKEVILEKVDDESEKVRPRTLIDIPINCYYSTCNLYFTFLDDLGALEITVINQSLGIISTRECDSAFGSIVVPVSSESGSYLIEIVTNDGECYYGEYTL